MKFLKLLTERVDKIIQIKQMVSIHIPPLLDVPGTQHTVLGRKGLQLPSASDDRVQLGKRGQTHWGHRTLSGPRSRSKARLTDQWPAHPSSAPLPVLWYRPTGERTGLSLGPVLTHRAALGGERPVFALTPARSPSRRLHKALSLGG